MISFYKSNYICDCFISICNFVQFIKIFQNDKDKANFEKLLDAMKSSKKGKTVGVFIKDGFPGEFCESWKAALKTRNFENVDIGAAIAYIMCPKDEPEINSIKKASMVSVDLFTKYLKDQIMDIIDSDKVSHSLFQLFFRKYVMS